VIGAKDERIAVLTAALEAALDRERRLELRLAEVERRLTMDSTPAAPGSSDTNRKPAQPALKVQPPPRVSVSRSDPGQDGLTGPAVALLAASSWPALPDVEAVPPWRAGSAAGRIA
jgi:hypothetical protein